MPDDRQRGLPVAHDYVGELVHRAVESRLDVHRIGVERGVAGHGDPHHVVGHLFDARLARLDLLLKVFLEVALLAVHVGADRRAGKPAADRADERAPAAVLMVGYRAHDSANADADENPRLHALEGAAAGSLHLCATCERDAHCHNHHISLYTTSVRRIFAPSTMAFIFPKATSRGRYFIPQSGARMASSFFTNLRAFLIRSATCCGASTVMSERSRQPTMIFLPCNFASTAQSSLDCAVSIETCRQEQPASSGRKE